ncbi:MAG: hypothetical protein AAF533_10375 [Acidobacteriota bacterium]
MSEGATAPGPWWLRNGWWLGVPFAVANLIAYFTFFVKWPDLRDHPWPSLLIGLLILTWIVVGAGLAWKQGAWLRRLGALALGAFGLLVSLLLPFYVFGLSYQVPEPTATTEALTVAPDFTLTDDQGASRSLSEFRGKKVLIVFYRGWW